jgi:hypothetical protein
VSAQTKSPTDTAGTTNPKSSVASRSPSSVSVRDAAVPVDESTARSAPDPARVGTYGSRAAEDPSTATV